MASRRVRSARTRMVDETTARRTHQRWFPVLALVAVATMINYLDRTVLGIAAPYLTKELGLTAAALGIVFSAFSWSYALLQIPGGIFLDRFGTRVTYSLSLTLWSGFTALMGVVTGLPGLILTRIGVGVFEAPCFPANSRILATWFPQNERARANSIYSVGQYAGIAFLSVPLFWVTQQFGWRGLFFMAGGFGVALGALFWWRYREPSQDRTINAAELAYIEAGGGGEYTGARVSFSWRHIGWLLRHRQIVGASIGQFGGNSTQVFFVTWFPTYLVNVRGMTFINAGLMTMLPYIGASIGVLVAGQLSDRLLKRTGSANLARKLPIVGGMLLASTIIAANFVPDDSNLLVVAIMSVAFFGQGMTNLGWTVISDVAPKKLIGLTAGIFNFSANLAGIVTPLVIGYAYQATGSFFGPLIYIGVVALVGAFSYSVILGDIHRLDMED
ncbi:MAG: D-galactonate transporter DgoT [Acidobacteria bacterium RIFCSPLOWO2_12_FULL_67_14b]|nr:MAG: D-galactonate transporter DgoT [Acidobacteria bacterium RIFCSPLOWO2_12_FULL_67_14b]